MVILQGLKPTFDIIIQSMSVNNNIESIVLEQVIDILVFEDERRNKFNNKNNENSEHLFYSNTKGNNKDKNKNRNVFHKNIKCFNCNVVGLGVALYLYFTNKE